MKAALSANQKRTAISVLALELGIKPTTRLPVVKAYLEVLTAQAAGLVALESGDVDRAWRELTASGVKGQLLAAEILKFMSGAEGSR